MSKFLFLVSILVSSIIYGQDSYDRLFIANDKGLLKAEFDGSEVELLKDFTGVRRPNKLIEVNGTFYGTAAGGTNNHGAIYSIEPDGTGFTRLHDFDNTNGSVPLDRLTFFNEKLWGITQQGGVSGRGVIFSVDLDGSNFQVHYSFDDADGKFPERGLTYHDGLFYGVAKQGGNLNYGVVYTLNTDGTNYQVIHYFDRTEGLEPNSNFTFSNNLLWGIARRGGTDGRGVIYTIDPSDKSFNKVADFRQVVEGANPSGNLAEVDGVLYGVCESGGSDTFDARGAGTVYSIKNDGTEFQRRTQWYSDDSRRSPVGDMEELEGRLLFTLYNERDSPDPDLRFLQAWSTEFDAIQAVVGVTEVFTSRFTYLTVYNGSLYIASDDIGAQGEGALIRYDFSPTTEILYDYGNADGIDTDWIVSVGDELIGITARGGGAGDGTIFRIGKDGSGFEIIHSFDSDIEINSNTVNYGEPILIDGYIYATRSDGGDDHDGVIYRIDTETMTYEELHTFIGSTNGRTPFGGVIEFNDQLWGMTYAGGANNGGTIYKLDKDGTNFSVVYSFSLSENYYPVGELAMANGFLWGRTMNGGDDFQGAVFKYDPDLDVFTEIYSFFDSHDQFTYFGSFINYDDKLWGITSREGTNRVGSIFSIDPTTDTYAVVYSFESDLGPMNQPLSLIGDKLFGSIAFDQEVFSYDLITGDFQVILQSESGHILGLDQRLITTLDFAVNDQTYGDDPFTLTATTNSTETITYESSDNSILEILNDEATIEGAGEVTITAILSGNDSYQDASVDQIITVEKSELLANASDVSKNYGATNPSLAIQYSGFVNGDDESVIDTPPIATTAADSNSDVGSYEITLSEGSDDNYSITNSSGVLSVEKTELLASVSNISRSYGEANPEFELTYSGFANGENESVLDNEPVPSTVANESSDVGEYAISLTEVLDNNYEITNEEGILSIGKAPLVVSVENESRIYGVTNPSFSLSYDGFVNNEDADVLDSEPVVTTTATQTSDVGTYLVTVSNLTDNNYEISTQDGQLTVEKAGLTISVLNAEKTYGAENPTFEIEYNGFVNEDNDSVLDEVPTATTNANQTSDVGEYEITLSTVTDNNYEISSVNGVMTIQKANLTVRVLDATRIYAAENPNFEIEYDGFVNGEDENVLDNQPAASTDADDFSDVGEYEISLSTELDNNYELAIENGLLTIEQASLNAIVEDVSRIYGTNNPAFVINYEGFVNEEDESVLLETPQATTDATATSDVGEYVVGLSGGVATNYRLTLQDGMLTINKASLIARANDQEIAEGDDLPEFTVSYSGFLNDDTESVIDQQPEANVSLNDSATPGTFEIVVSGGSDNNYEFGYENGTLVINDVLSVGLDQEIEIYPNPTSSYVFVSGNKIETAKLFDQKGHLIQKVSVGEKIDMSNLTTGVYIIQLFNERNEQIHIQRIIKK